MWIAAEQLVGLVGEATIYRKTKKNGEWTWMLGPKQGRRGQRRKLILVESLPPELQLAIAKKLPDQVHEEIPQPQADSPSDEAPKLDLITEALKRFPFAERDAWIAELNRLSNLIERYSKINPKRIKNSNTNKHEFVTAVLDLCQEAACTDEVILSREPHRGQPPSPYTLYDWYRDYRKNGLLAFIRSNNHPRNDLNAANHDGRRATISPEAVEWINKYWRNYRHPRALYEAAKQKAKKQRWIIPAESWFYRRWKNLPKPVLSLHLHGEKDYLSKHAPYVPRDASDLAALQLLCGDHRRCDVGVVWRDGRTLMRPWLTLWQCVRTGLIWGWHLDVTPSSYTIGMAYAGGVIQFGAQPPGSPERNFQSFVYTDNGRDYRSKNFDGTITVHKKAARLDGGIELIRVQQEIGIYRDAQVEQYFARKGNAREKPLERTNRDIADWEEEEFDEWCGRDAKEKPETWVEMWHQHQKFLKGKRASSPFMSFDEYLEHLAGWIQAYNSKPHERTVLGGAKIVPLEEYQRLYTTRYDISHESLALLLMHAERRTIGKIGVGCEAAYKTWKYFNRAMAEFKGCEVEVRYDSNDLSRVWVILPNGQPCEAELVEKSGYMTPNKQTVSLMKRQEAFERKTFRDWNLINQSIVRGDTLEDRVVAQYEIESDETEAVAMEAGSPARVHQLTRMDKPKLRAVPRTRAITVDQIASVEADDSIFAHHDSGKVSEFDFDE